MMCVDCVQYRHEGACDMGWEPITFCKDCGEPFDVYMAPEHRICDCCQFQRDMAEAQAEMMSDLPQEENNEPQ